MMIFVTKMIIFVTKIDDICYKKWYLSQKMIFVTKMMIFVTKHDDICYKKWWYLSQNMIFVTKNDDICYKKWWYLSQNMMIFVTKNICYKKWYLSQNMMIFVTKNDDICYKKWYLLQNMNTNTCRIFECQGCTNVGRQVIRVSKFYTAGSNVFWVPCRGLALLAAKILRWILDFLEKKLLPLV
jgi:hypothetical protein